MKGTRLIFFLKQEGLMFLSASADVSNVALQTRWCLCCLLKQHNTVFHIEWISLNSQGSLPSLSTSPHRAPETGPCGAQVKSEKEIQVKYQFSGFVRLKWVGQTCSGSTERKPCWLVPKLSEIVTLQTHNQGESTLTSVSRLYEAPTFN